MKHSVFFVKVRRELLQHFKVDLCRCCGLSLLLVAPSLPNPLHSADLVAGRREKGKAKASVKCEKRRGRGKGSFLLKIQMRRYLSNDMHNRQQTNAIRLTAPVHLPSSPIQSALTPPVICYWTCFKFSPLLLHQLSPKF